MAPRRGGIGARKVPLRHELGGAAASEERRARWRCEQCTHSLTLTPIGSVKMRIVTQAISDILLLFGYKVEVVHRLRRRFDFCECGRSDFAVSSLLDHDGSKCATW